MNITEFLLARIAEDERVAREAIVKQQFLGRTDNGVWEAWGSEVSSATFFQIGPSEEPPIYFIEPAQAAHIACHDPARVLRECEAKRELVDGWHDEHGGGHVLKTLAAVYYDHPDYNPNWAP